MNIKQKRFTYFFTNQQYVRYNGPHIGNEGGFPWFDLWHFLTRIDRKLDHRLFPIEK